MPGRRIIYYQTGQPPTREVIAHGDYRGFVQSLFGVSTAQIYPNPNAGRLMNLVFAHRCVDPTNRRFMFEGRPAQP